MQLLFSFCVALFISLLPLQVSETLYAQAPSEKEPLVLLDHVTQVTSLSNGIVVRQNGVLEEITALRDDLLRIRIAPEGLLPEDASWAVLAEARRSSVAVTPETANGRVGFRTHLLRIEVDRSTMTLTVRDLNGNILQQDARPTRF